MLPLPAASNRPPLYLAAWTLSAGVYGYDVERAVQPDPRIQPNPRRLIVHGGPVSGRGEIRN